MQTIEQIADRRFRSMLAGIKKRNLKIRTEYPVIAAQEWLESCDLDEAIRWWNAGVFDAACANVLRRASVNPSRLASASGTLLGHRFSDGDLSLCDVMEALKRHG